MSQKRDTQHIVYNEVPATRPAPIAQSGVRAWIRENLLKTPLDIVLTLIGALVLLAVIVSFIQWTVRDANWWAISFNWTQFFKGRFEVAYEWRLVVVTLVAVFIVGMAVAVWLRRLTRLGLWVFIILVALIVIVPSVLIALFPKPAVSLAVGNQTISIGTFSEAVRPQLAFMGRAGETVRIRIQEGMDDESRLANLNGFMDSIVNVLRATSQSRADGLRNQAEMQDLLARHDASAVPLLTQNQRTILERDLERLSIPTPPTSDYALNQHGVTVQVLGADLQALSDPVTLMPQEDRHAIFSLPADGWYVLDKRIAEGAGEGVTVLTVEGVYPIMQSLRLDDIESTTGGASSRGFVDVFIRMTDNYRIGSPIPQVDGANLPFFVINEHQYRGSRPLETYLRLYLAPFLQKVGGDLVLVYAVGIAGYLLARLIERLRHAESARRMTTILLLALVPFVWVMVSGFIMAEIFQSILLGSALAWLYAAYGLGMSLGRNVLGIGLMVAGSLLVMLLPQLIFQPSYGFGLLALVNLFILPLAFMSFLNGAESYGIEEAGKVRRTQLISLSLFVAVTLLPLVLIVLGVSPTRVDPNWVLAHSDQRRWGGLLLTMVLTLFGIIASFPLGVALALGRRSTMPAIQYGCTLYIELVRGSPFITVLFMMQLMIPLISPAFAEIPNSTRALIATILFSAAYLAENVRGGLQAIPSGQVEAARALGMSSWQIIRLITLPQALRIVIPVLVGQFISLFKDTSLVAIVGLIDLTGYVNTMVVQPEFSGTRPEGLLFITVIYFSFSYVMSYVSKLLEASGSGSTRRL